MSTPIALKFSKAWQTAHHQLVLMLGVSSYLSEKYSLGKKLYMIISAEQSTYGISFSNIKPENLLTQHALINTVRKYCRSGVITSISRSRVNDDQFVSLNCQGSVWHIYLRKSRPPEMMLINDNHDAYVKHGQGGTFTKRHHIEDLDLSEAENTIEAKLIEFANGNAGSAEPTPNPAGDDMIDKCQRQLATRLVRRAKTVRKFIDKQLSNLPSEDQIRQAKLIAESLQTFAHLAKTGDQALEIPAELSLNGRALTIELDSSRTIGDEINRQFQQLKRLQRAQSIGQKQLNEARIQHQKLLGTIDRLRTVPLDEAEICRISSHYRLAASQNLIKRRQPVSLPYRNFRLGNGQPALVGKTAADNDELTKSARSNATWLHVVAGSGSHVILPFSRQHGSPSPSILRQAAILAIHYSDHRQTRAGEVYVTQKQHLQKRKGMPPGKWIVSRSETLFASYTDQELQEIIRQTPVDH